MKEKTDQSNIDGVIKNLVNPLNGKTFYNFSANINVLFERALDNAVDKYADDAKEESQTTDESCYSSVRQ